MRVRGLLLPKGCQGAGSRPGAACFGQPQAAGRVKRCAALRCCARPAGLTCGWKMGGKGGCSPRPSPTGAGTVSAAEGAGGGGATSAAAAAADGTSGAAAGAGAAASPPAAPPAAAPPEKRCARFWPGAGGAGAAPGVGDVDLSLPGAEPAAAAGAGTGAGATAGAAGAAEAGGAAAPAAGGACPAAVPVKKGRARMRCTLSTISLSAGAARQQ